MNCELIFAISCSSATQDSVRFHSTVSFILFELPFSGPHNPPVNYYHSPGICERFLFACFDTIPSHANLGLGQL